MLDTSEEYTKMASIEALLLLLRGRSVSIHHDARRARPRRSRAKTAKALGLTIPRRSCSGRTR